MLSVMNFWLVLSLGGNREIKLSKKINNKNKKKQPCRLCLIVMESARLTVPEANGTIQNSMANGKAKIVT